MLIAYCNTFILASSLITVITEITDKEIYQDHDDADCNTDIYNGAKGDVYIAFADILESVDRNQYIRGNTY